MSQSFIKEIGIWIFLWCFTVTSSVTTDPRHSPKSTSKQHFSVRLQDNVHYIIRKSAQNIISNRIFSGQDRIEKSRKLMIIQSQIPKSTEFFCNITGTRSITKPTSVHELRPGDIDVIGGIGGSFVVGTGSFSYTLPQLVTDHRGTSFAAGGQGTWREFLTLPNIIKEFNPNLIGYAYGDSLPQERFSQLNVAEVGALSSDAPFMTKELVKRIKIDKRININNDWKLITIMMSTNTFCRELCYNDHTTYAERRKVEMMKSLLYIKENLPRTIVNLIITLDLDLLYTFTNLPLVCYLTRIIECPCLFATQFKHRLQDYKDIMKKFQKIDKEIVESEELKDKDDFTVVLQTFQEHLKFPVNRFNSTDVSYLASDCFHFSQKGYARMANALWNNMMEPVGGKSTDWSKEFDRFICPTDKSPYIRTWKNSIA